MTMRDVLMVVIGALGAFASIPIIEAAAAFLRDWRHFETWRRGE